MSMGATAIPGSYVIRRRAEWHLLNPQQPEIVTNFHGQIEEYDVVVAPDLPGGPIASIPMLAQCSRCREMIGIFEMPDHVETCGRG